MSRAQRILESIASICEFARVVFHARGLSTLSPFGNRVPVVTSDNVVQAFNELGGDVPSLRGIYVISKKTHYAWNAEKALHHDVMEELITRRITDDLSYDIVLWRVHAPLKEAIINDSDWPEWKEHGDDRYFRGFKVKPGSTDW